MKLTVVGCSGSFPGPDSPASCYLVQAEHEGRTWNLVLDLGNGALGPLQHFVGLGQIDAIVISHLHPDHCLDLCGLFVVQKYDPTVSEGGHAAIPVFGPQDTGARISRANGVTVAETEDVHGLDPQFDFRVLRSGISFVMGPFTITPTRVNHPVEAYGVRVEAGGRTLAYSGDTDVCPALTGLLQGADLALVDSAFVEGRDTVEGIHLSGTRAAQAALDAGGVARLMLTHIPPWNDPEACHKEAATVWPGDVELARAGASYDV